MKTRKQLSFFEYFSPYVFRVFDFLLVFGSFYFAHYFRFNHLNLKFEYEILSLLASFFVLVSVSMFGVYMSWRGKSRLEMMSRLLLAWSLAFLALLALLALGKKGADFSRLWLGYSFFTSFFTAVIVRFALYGFMDFLRSKGLNQKNLLIIGVEQGALKLAEHISKEKWLGLNIIATLNTKLQDLATGENIVAESTSLEKFIAKKDVRELWISLPLKESDAIDELLFSLRHSTVCIRYVPDMSAFRLLNHQVSDIGGIATIDLSFSPLDGANVFIKRIEDITLALLITLFISPLLLIIAITIKLTSKGPVIFKQLRHGADGRPINVYKFRTMYLHQESNGKVSQAVKNDVRVTPVGAFLRKTSLDELPQFYNVLQGRMSVVGPRPHAIAHNEYYKEIIESYMQRHKVKPGITGWAQVNGFRGETDTLEKMEERVVYDLFYIDNWSLFFDLKIVFLSIFKGFASKNAY